MSLGVERKGSRKKTSVCRDVDIWKTLYASLVRPHLEYAVSVWKLRLIEARRDSGDLIQTYRLIKRLKQVYKHCIPVLLLNALKKNFDVFVQGVWLVIIDLYAADINQLGSK